MFVADLIDGWAPKRAELRWHQYATIKSHIMCNPAHWCLRHIYNKKTNKNVFNVFFSDLQWAFMTEIIVEFRVSASFAISSKFAH